MFNDPIAVVIGIAVLAVLAVLAFGIGTFAKGGEFNRKNANKLMRWRIGLQFLAVVLVLGYVALRGQGGQ
ncbi:MAG: twin transmembrane helix small protein [Pseudomonadota bacterium]